MASYEKEKGSDPPGHNILRDNRYSHVVASADLPTDHTARSGSVKEDEYLCRDHRPLLPRQKQETRER